MEGSTVRTDAGRVFSNEHLNDVDTGAEEYHNSLPRFPQGSDGLKVLIFLLYGGILC